MAGGGRMRGPICCFGHRSMVAEPKGLEESTEARQGVTENLPKEVSRHSPEPCEAAAVTLFTTELPISMEQSPKISSDQLSEGGSPINEPGFEDNEYPTQLTTTREAEQDEVAVGLPEVAREHLSVADVPPEDKEQSSPVSEIPLRGSFSVSEAEAADDGDVVRSLLEEVPERAVTDSQSKLGTSGQEAPAESTADPLDAPPTCGGELVEEDEEYLEAGDAERKGESAPLAVTPFEEMMRGLCTVFPILLCQPSGSEN